MAWHGMAWGTQADLACVSRFVPAGEEKLEVRGRKPPQLPSPYSPGSKLVGEGRGGGGSSIRLSGFPHRTRTAWCTLPFRRGMDGWMDDGTRGGVGR